VEVHAVDHVNGGTVNVVDNTTLNYGKVRVKRWMEHCIEMVKSEVIRTQTFEDKYGAEHVSLVRRFKEADERGTYQLWEDGKYVRTLPEEEGDLIYQEKKLQNFSVVATIDDIFADIWDAVEMMPDGAEKSTCRASFEKTRQDFDNLYQNKNQDGWMDAFQVMQSLTQKIYDGMDWKSKKASEVVQFLNSYAYGGKTWIYPRRWTVERQAAYLVEYYQKAPVTLKLAKLKRIAAGGGSAQNVGI
jgi:hypothetical protein